MLPAILLLRKQRVFRFPSNRCFNKIFEEVRIMTKRTLYLLYIFFAAVMVAVALLVLHPVPVMMQTVLQPTIRRSLRFWMVNCLTLSTVRSISGVRQSLSSTTSPTMWNWATSISRFIIISTIIHIPHQLATVRLMQRKIR